MSVAFDDINQIICVVVAHKLEVGIVDFVLLHDAFNDVLVDFGWFLLELHMDAANLLRLDDDLLFLFIQPDSSLFKLSGKLLLLFLAFLSI